MHYPPPAPHPHRREGGDRKLILRMPSRKNLPGGCILIRPCFCTLSKTASRKLRAMHFCWPEIRRRTRPGSLIFPIYNRRNAIPAIRDILTKLLFPHAVRYASNGFRRRAALELKTAGPQWSTVATMVEWRSLAFTVYVDLANEVPCDLPKLLI